MNTPSDSESESESEQTMQRAVKKVLLGDLSTLRQLYKKSVLAAPENPPLHPVRSDLLDRVTLFQGDITKLEVDSIVNAANRSLLGGGGVDGAIHDAAGPGLRKECRKLDGCETGDAKITGGHRLPAKHIIHTVGPIYHRSDGSRNEELLTSCYKRSLEVAAENKLKHVAFCSISTGIYGYPVYDATRIALDTSRKFMDEVDAKEGYDAKLDRLIFVVWSDKDKGVYEELLPEYFPPDEEAKPDEEVKAMETEEAEAAKPEEGEEEPEAAADEEAKEPEPEVKAKA